MHRPHKAKNGINFPVCFDTILAYRFMRESVYADSFFIKQRNKKPPLCKGRWVCEANSEGLSFFFAILPSYSVCHTPLHNEGFATNGIGEMIKNYVFFLTNHFESSKIKAYFILRVMNMNVSFISTSKYFFFFSVVFYFGYAYFALKKLLVRLDGTR